MQVARLVREKWSAHRNSGVLRKLQTLCISHGPIHRRICWGKRFGVQPMMPHADHEQILAQALPWWRFSAVLPGRRLTDNIPGEVEGPAHNSWSRRSTQPGAWISWPIPCPMAGEQRKIEARRKYDNESRPHSVLAWSTPAECAPLARLFCRIGSCIGGGNFRLRPLLVRGRPQASGIADFGRCESGAGPAPAFGTPRFPGSPFSIKKGVRPQT